MSYVLQPGKMRLSLTWMATKLDASHHVEPDQFEPGIGNADQADLHVLDFVLMHLNLNFAYVVTKRLELSVTIPLRWAMNEAAFLDKDGNELVGFNSIHHRNEVLFGVGDVSLNGRIRILAQSKTGTPRLDLIAGLSLPTGRVEENPFELGRQGKEHQHMFFGTGTFDPRLALEFEQPVGEASLLADLSWRGALYEGPNGYQGSQTVWFGLSATSALGLDGWRFRAGAEFLKEWPAYWGNDAVNNSGRTDLSPFVGVNWMATTDLSVTAMIKKPFVLSYRGSQLAIPFVLMLGAAYSFGGD